MAVPPTIPTSFVPKQPVNTQPRKQRSGTNAFMLVAVAVAGLSIIAAAGVFGYEYFLKGVRAAKVAELDRAQQAVNIDTVESYIRLKDRLNTTKTILDRHVESSEFFDVLEQLTLQNVRFNTLSITVAEDRTAEIEMGGTARSFNALAAQSQKFAAEKRIKRAIFSGIDVNENDTVNFKLTASIDSRLITSSDVLPGIQEPQLPPVEEMAVPAAETPAEPASADAPAP